MKKADIYEITIKVLGLYLLIADISKLPSLLTFIGSREHMNAEQGTEQMRLFYMNGLSFILLIAFAIFLIAKTKFITKLITAASDYQENAKLFADRKVIYEIALIIIGALLIVGTLPDLLYHVLNLNTAADQSSVISSCSKLFIGILTVGYAKRIALYYSK